MKIKYVGLKGSGKKSAGCSKCGKRKVVNRSIQYSKRMILPTGRSLNFVIGQVIEVTESEGEYLKNWYQPNGQVDEYPFIEVK